jgi:hypothetical protein
MHRKIAQEVTMMLQQRSNRQTPTTQQHQQLNGGPISRRNSGNTQN